MYGMSKHDREQDDEEQEIFRGFAEAAGFGVLDNIEKREPGEPDILCVMGGETRVFEITMVSDQNLSAGIGRLKSGKSDGCEWHSYSDPVDVENAIERKALMRYGTGGNRCDLLLYCDNIHHPRVHIPFVREILIAKGNEHAELWGQIWIYDKADGKSIPPGERMLTADSCGTGAAYSGDSEEYNQKALAP